MLQTGQVQNLFDVSPQTVRNWTKEFEEYLSASATPNEKGSRRFYTVEDLMVFALVVEKTQTGATYEEIRVALKNGERATPPELEENEDEQLASQMTAREFALARSIIQERDKAIGQLEMLEKDREKDRDTIQHLNRAIGKLEYQLEMLREQLKKDND